MPGVLSAYFVYCCFMLFRLLVFYMFICLFFVGFFFLRSFWLLAGVRICTTANDVWSFLEASWDVLCNNIWCLEVVWTTIGRCYTKDCFWSLARLFSNIFTRRNYFGICWAFFLWGFFAGSMRLDESFGQVLGGFVQQQMIFEVVWFVCFLSFHT